MPICKIADSTHWGYAALVKNEVELRNNVERSPRYVKYERKEGKINKNAYAYAIYVYGFWIFALYPVTLVTHGEERKIFGLKYV